MNSLQTLPALLLLAPLAGDGPALTFTKGQALTQAWTIKAERTADVASITFNGNEQDIGTGSTSTSVASVEVVDRVLEAKDGALTRFSRTYDTVSSSREVEGFDAGEGVSVDEGDDTSALQGLEVVFAYDEDEGAHEAAWGEDSEGEEEWLEGLVAHSYLPGLLPDEEVSEGDAWDLSPEFVTALLKPLGEVQVEEGEDGPEAPEGGIAISVPNANDHFDWTAIEGDIKARWKSTEADDDRRVAEIVLSVELNGSQDLSEALEDAAADRGVEESYEVADASLDLEGEVVVLWDLDANRPLSVSGELEGASAFEAAWTIDAGFAQIDIACERENAERYVIEAAFGAE